MPLILHNNFSRDSYALRGERTTELSGNIAEVAADLGLTQAQTDWAIASFPVFLQAQAKRNVEEGEKRMAQEAYENAYDKGYQLYMRIKELLTALIMDTPQEEEIERAYGIKGRSPQNYNELTGKIQTMVDENDILVADGDSRIAPTTAIDQIKVDLTNLIKARQLVGVERKESAQAYDSLHALFEEDTQQLRIIYQIATLVWGPRSPNLLAIGFAPLKPHPGGGQPADPKDFIYQVDGVIVTFRWGLTDHATSYQLAYSDDNELWEELYAGDLLTYGYEPPVGKCWYRVRARNSNGFGDWSDTISYERPEDTE
jgi:hypothetical protein